MKLIKNKLIITFGELEDLYKGFKECKVPRKQNCLIVIPRREEEAKE